MGKGDVKSKKGKIINGSFGVNRQARTQNKITVNTAAISAAAAPAKKASKKKA